MDRLGDVEAGGTAPVAVKKGKGPAVYKRKPLKDRTNLEGSTPVKLLSAITSEQKGAGDGTCSVYTRRKRSVCSLKDDKQNKKCVSPIKESRPFSFQNDASDVLLKAFLEPRKKRLRQGSNSDNANHNMPQEFIQKQKAYFQEIDAFDLATEVASDSEVD